MPGRTDRLVDERGPAGQHLRPVLHIRLREVGHAGNHFVETDREQLHQLAHVVLVRHAREAVADVEPLHHRAVGRQRFDEVVVTLRRIEGVPLDQRHVLEAMVLDRDPEIPSRRREAVVPEVEHPPHQHVDAVAQEQVVDVVLVLYLIAEVDPHALVRVAEEAQRVETDVGRRLRVHQRLHGRDETGLTHRFDLGGRHVVGHAARQVLCLARRQAAGDAVGGQRVFVAGELRHVGRHRDFEATAGLRPQVVGDREADDVGRRRNRRIGLEVGGRLVGVVENDCGSTGLRPLEGQRTATGVVGLAAVDADPGAGFGVWNAPAMATGGTGDAEI